MGLPVRAGRRRSARGGTAGRGRRQQREVAGGRLVDTVAEPRGGRGGNAGGASRRGYVCALPRPPPPYLPAPLQVAPTRTTGRPSSPPLLCTDRRGGRRGRGVGRLSSREGEAFPPLSSPPPCPPSLPPSPPPLDASRMPIPSRAGGRRGTREVLRLHGAANVASPVNLSHAPPYTRVWGPPLAPRPARVGRRRRTAVGQGRTDRRRTDPPVGRGGERPRAGH